MEYCVERRFTDKRRRTESDMTNRALTSNELLLALPQQCMCKSTCTAIPTRASKASEALAELVVVLGLPLARFRAQKTGDVRPWLLATLSYLSLATISLHVHVT